jgi:hypothetical protein
LKTCGARAESGDFQRLPNDRSTFGYRDGALWFHFSATNLGPGRERWIFAIEYALLDHVALYRIDPDGRLTERLSGDRTPFASRDLALRNLNFELMLPPGQATDFYLRVVSESSMQVPMVLARPDAYMQSLLPGHIGLGLYYGIQIALLMYNLILWISVRDRNFLWYVLYAGTLGMLLLALNGLAFQYLWPRFPDWANLAIPIGIALFQPVHAAVLAQLPGTGATRAARRSPAARFHAGSRRSAGRGVAAALSRRDPVPDRAGPAAGPDHPGRRRELPAALCPGPLLHPWPGARCCWG